MFVYDTVQIAARGSRAVVINLCRIAPRDRGKVVDAVVLCSDKAEHCALDKAERLVLQCIGYGHITPSALYEHLKDEGKEIRDRAGFRRGISEKAIWKCLGGLCNKGLYVIVRVSES